MRKVYQYVTLLFMFVTLVSSLSGQVTLATWTFLNDPDNATCDGGIAANSAKTIGAYSNGTLNGTTAYNVNGVATKSASNTAIWDYTGGADYWQIDVVTTGYNTVTVSYSLNSTVNKSPEDFKTQYNIGSGWVDFGAAITLVKNTWHTGTDIALPSACDNQANVSIRWVTTSDWQC